MSQKILRLFTLLCLVPSAVPAQTSGPLVTDRPDQTESAVTVQPRFIQIESGISFASEAAGNNRLLTLSMPGTLLRVGVLSKVEARVGFAGWQRAEVNGSGVTETDRGIGDLAVGAKLLLLEEGAGRPQLAILASTTLPTGQAGFSSERADPTLLLAGSNTLSGRVSVGYNAGARWSTGEVGEDAAGSPILETVVHALYSIAFGLSLTDRVGAFVETFGALDLDRGGSNAVSVDGGVTFLVRDNVQIDTSGGVGLSPAADDWFVAAGLSVRVPQ